MSARTVMPVLIDRRPDCPLCGIEVSHDGDGWVCEDCQVTWPSDGPGGGESHSEVPECGREVMPWAGDDRPGRVRRFRCVLDEDHPLGPFDRHHGVDVTDPWHPDPHYSHEWRDELYPAAPPPLQGPLWFQPYVGMRPVELAVNELLADARTP